MASKRQSIITAIETRLKTIVAAQTVTMYGGTSHTYATTLTGHVFTWKTAPFQYSEVPGVNIKDERDSISRFSIGLDDHNMVVSIEAFAANDTALRSLIADIIACIGSDVTWGGLAEDTKPIGDETFAVEQKGKTIAGCKMYVTVEFATGLWNPDS